MQKLTLTLIYIIVIGGTTRSSSTCNSAQRQRLDQAEQSNHSQVVLNLLVTAPYPPSDGGWDGGIAVIPAVRLALRQILNLAVVWSCDCVSIEVKHEA